MASSVAATKATRPKVTPKLSRMSADISGERGFKGEITFPRLSSKAPASSVSDLISVAKSTEHIKVLSFVEFTKMAVPPPHGNPPCQQGGLITYGGDGNGTNGRQ